MSLFGGDAQAQAAAKHLIVLKAARMLDVRAGRVVEPGSGGGGRRQDCWGGWGQFLLTNAPAGAEVIDLGDVTLMPGMIDAHVHLFLHPGAEDLQTVEESVAKRTLIAMDAARLDLMARVYGRAGYGDRGRGAGG